ncbi:MAG: heme ABC transporter permease [Lysobacteraceae bacterium]|nr:MAG: heme ABC transporter permease [Xanthomonadaceae bacterium]
MIRVILLSVVVIVVIVAAPFIGLSLAEDHSGFIFWQLRVPRVVMASLVGAVLGLAGAVYQTIFHNPLATPSTVGTTAGAALGALVAVVLISPEHLILPLTVVFAFAGALAVTLLVTAIAASGRARIEDVLLAGIAISLAASALASGLQFSADIAATFQAVRWSLGHLGQVGYQRVLWLAPVAVIVIGVLLSQRRALQALLSGEESAFTQGVPVRRVRALSLAAGSLGVGACVALCGPIAFIGLIVPHLVRLSIGASRRLLLPLSAVAGAGFLVVCDTVARTVVDGREIPVGVITAGIGAPLIVWLVARSRR